MTDAGCQQAQQCIPACAGDAACANLCFYKYGTPAFIRFTMCAYDSKCAAPAPSNVTCPDWGSRPLADGFSVAALAEAGTLYPVLGTSPHDCLPCQKFEYQAVNESAVAVAWRADTGTGMGLTNVSFTMVGVGEGEAAASYDVAGAPVSERYFFLDYASDYVMYFYCGSMFGAEYLGAVVLAREPGASLPTDIQERLSMVLEDSDLADYVPPLDQFCKPQECMSSMG
jgi:hypothetical protein